MFYLPAILGEVRTVDAVAVSVCHYPSAIFGALGLVKSKYRILVADAVSGTAVRAGGEAQHFQALILNTQR